MHSFTLTGLWWDVGLCEHCRHLCLQPSGDAVRCRLQWWQDCHVGFPDPRHCQGHQCSRTSCVLSQVGDIELMAKFENFMNMMERHSFNLMLIVTKNGNRVESLFKSPAASDSVENFSDLYIYDHFKNNDAPKHLFHTMQVASLLLLNYLQCIMMHICLYF